MRVNKLIILVFVLAIFIVPNVLGVAIGVNKAVLNFNNVLRNGYAQDQLVISTDTSEEIGLERRLEGEIADWIRFDTEETIISGSQPGILTVIIEPPEDVANGLYEGEIRLITTPVMQSTTGKIGTSIRTSFLIKISVEVTGDEIVACTSGGFSIADAEITYPLFFVASVNNDGNVRIRPDFEIDIWNQDQTRLLLSRRFTNNEEIYPTTTSRIEKYLEDINLDTGQYWADIKAPMCGESSTITFNIVEKGEIVDKGELVSIKNPLWVEVGDIVPIEIVFKNTGSRSESAKVKGIIELAGQIVKVIDTDEVDVAPGEVVSLETFFNPKMSGQYIIKARVLYNNKLTFWKTSILNALPSEEYEKKISGMKLKQLSFVISLIVIVIIILLLLIIIKKKKKKTRKVKFKI